MSIVAERVGLNPPAEDPTVQSLDFVGLDPSWGIYLMGHDYAPPKPEAIRSGSADTDGDPVVSTKYGNRTITAKVRVVEPSDPAAVNKVVNPTAETDLVGITKAGTATQVRVVDPLATPVGLNLDTYLSMETSTSGARGVWKATPTIGVKETFSVYARVTALTGAAFVQAVVRTPAAATLATSARIEAVSAEGEWVRLTVSFTATEAGEHEFAVWQGTTGTASYRYTAGQLELGTVATHYFDGDTPGCDWSGARNGSASTRPAPDGTRFSRICRDVTRQIDRIKRTRQGVYRRISAQGGPMYWDLRVGEIAEAPTALDIQRKRAEYGLSFEALPGGRTAEQLIATKEEAALPYLSVLLENVPGELPALGRAQITDKQGVNQKTAWWGLEQTFYNAAATAEPFYLAEGRTILYGAKAALAGSAGANVVKSNALSGAAQSVISTQTTGGGAQLSHAGNFKVLARVHCPATNTGSVKVTFNYAQGDFVGTTESGNATITNTGHFQVVELGILNLQQAPAGTAQRWEGRVNAAMVSGAGVVNIDYLLFIPVSDGWGRADALAIVSGVPQLLGYDEFTASALAALAGQAAAVGGNWSGAGAATDFTVAESFGRKYAQRTAVNDVAETPRYELLGAGEYEAIEGSCEINLAGANSAQGIQGMISRYVDPNNWFMVALQPQSVAAGTAQKWNLRAYKKVAGVKTTLAEIQTKIGSNTNISWRVLNDGSWTATATTIGTGETFTITGSDAVLNSAGALKKGRIGLHDQYVEALAATRQYDNVKFVVPLIDAAPFANRALEIRNDRARRESSDGTTWGAIGSYAGDYLLVPPAGPEKRVSRLVTKLTRNAESDDGIDDLKGQLWVTPRYLHAAPY
jgi:hypothetical protein